MLPADPFEDAAPPSVLEAVPEGEVEAAPLDVAAAELEPEDVADATGPPGLLLGELLALLLAAVERELVPDEEQLWLPEGSEVTPAGLQMARA